MLCSIEIGLQFVLEKILYFLELMKIHRDLETAPQFNDSRSKLITGDEAIS